MKLSNIDNICIKHLTAPESQVNFYLKKNNDLICAYFAYI